MNFKIEKDIPVPPRWGTKYPFYKMDKGDSFSFDIKFVHKISAAAHVYGKKHNKEFSVRTVNNVSRIWRVK